MIKEIVRDIGILKTPATLVSLANAELAAQLVVDLMETAYEHRDRCLGLAAIQIGVPIQVIVVRNKDGQYIPMFNPRIIKRSNRSATLEEGCMSLDTTTPVSRPVSVDVMYQTRPLGRFIRESGCTGVYGRVIQHEIDHLKGVVI